MQRILGIAWLIAKVRPIDPPPRSSTDAPSSESCADFIALAGTIYIAAIAPAPGVSFADLAVLAVRCSALLARLGLYPRATDDTADVSSFVSVLCQVGLSSAHRWREFLDSCSS